MGLLRGSGLASSSFRALALAQGPGDLFLHDLVLLPQGLLLAVQGLDADLGGLLVVLDVLEEGRPCPLTLISREPTFL